MCNKNEEGDEANLGWKPRGLQTWALASTPRRSCCWHSREGCRSGKTATRGGACRLRGERVDSIEHGGRLLEIDTFSSAKKGRDLLGWKQLEEIPHENCSPIPSALREVQLPASTGVRFSTAARSVCPHHAREAETCSPRSEIQDRKNRAVGFQ